MYRRFALFVMLFSSYQNIFSQSRDLNFYLQNGIANSPLLKDYSNLQQQNRIDSMLVLAQKKISVSVDGLVQIAPVINGIGYEEQISNRGQYAAVVGANQPIFQSKMVNGQLNSVHIQSQMISANQKISQRELEKAITDQYLTSYHSISEMQFQQQTISSLQNQEKILKELVNSGIYLETDYLTLQLQIQTEKINLKQMQDDYRSNLYALNALCGIADTTTLQIEKPDLVWKGASTNANPNLLLYSLDSFSIEASKDLLHFNYVPKVNLHGDAGYMAIPADFSVKKFGFSAGVSLAWNIYDGSKKNLQMQQFSVQQSTYSFYKSNYSLRLSMQLADLEKKLQSSNEIISQWQNQIKDMNKLLSMRRDQMESGQLSMIDYLLLIRSYRDLQKNLNDAEMKQQQIISEHNYLLW
ncbi:MAG: TolC family protein [Chitinophagales bacterium]|nr:TolC family protein [Chitinophagales bacterium]